MSFPFLHPFLSSSFFTPPPHTRLALPPLFLIYRKLPLNDILLLPSSSCLLCFHVSYFYFVYLIFLASPSPTLLLSSSLPAFICPSFLYHHFFSRHLLRHIYIFLFLLSLLLTLPLSVAVLSHSLSGSLFVCLSVCPCLSVSVCLTFSLSLSSPPSANSIIIHIRFFFPFPLPSLISFLSEHLPLSSPASSHPSCIPHSLFPPFPLVSSLFPLRSPPLFS